MNDRFNNAWELKQSLKKELDDELSLKIGLQLLNEYGIELYKVPAGMHKSLIKAINEFAFVAKQFGNVQKEETKSSSGPSMK